MAETPDKSPHPQVRISLLTGTLLILVAIVLLSLLFGPIFTPDHPHHSRRVTCQVNLKQLTLGLIIYAAEYDDLFPSALQWCDLTVDVFGGKEEMIGICRCKGDQEGPCSYALNPHADPFSVSDMVLLFESQPGWNQFGGPELLTMEKSLRKEH